MPSSQLRNKAFKLAPADWAEAAKCARQIDEPWYACQAFAACARFAPLGEARSLISRAFQEADGGKDSYRRIAVRAWPLRALIELGDVDRAELEFDRIAPAGMTIQPPSSRAEACLLIFQAVAPGGPGLMKKAVQWLLRACQPIEHWRQARAVEGALLISISQGAVEPEEIPCLVADEKIRRKIEKRLDRGERAQARPFFP